LNIATTKKWQSRLITISISAILIVIGLTLILTTFNDNIVFFYSPSEIKEKQGILKGKPFRVGGLVKEGSIKKNGSQIEFVITDLSEELKITYNGMPPGLFKEGQGAVAFGNFADPNLFVAEEILAKHDENYVPREVQNSLKKANLQGDS
jgi:cytochrome c-type biogenesis protein CcmE